MKTRTLSCLCLCLVTLAHAAVVVEYEFEGDAMDSSGNNEHGTLMGGATFGPGYCGQALQLNGSNQYVAVPISSYTFNQFTMECWINVPTYGTNLHYLSLHKNAYLVLGDYGSGVLSTWADGLSPIDAGPAGMTSLSTGMWHHIAFTYDGADQVLYIDGMEVLRVASSGAVNNSASFADGFNIGARYTGTTQFVNGLIDNVRLHDVAVPRMSLGYYTDCRGVEVRTVTATPVRVAPGQNGAMVSFDAENIGVNPASITAADLSFFDAMMNDVSAEYTVTPSGMNPTMIPVGATATFDFLVDVTSMPTLGTITVDGSIDSVDTVTMMASTDSDADTPDTWDVVGAVPELRTVSSSVGIVSQGGTAYDVTVTAENTGLTQLQVGSVSLTFTGSADRTAEYTVTPSPANPTTIAPGASESFDFLVDVDAMATVEVVTLDAELQGTSAVSGAAVQDVGADVTTTWDVMMCFATLCGDCNGDGILSIVDALTAAQHSAGLIALMGVDFTNCNVIGALEPNPSAEVDILDALTLAQAAAGLPVALICC